MEEIKIINLDEDLEASAARLVELQAGRNLADIHITDDYWKALRKHQASHGRSK